MKNKIYAYHFYATLAPDHKYIIDGIHHSETKIFNADGYQELRDYIRSLFAEHLNKSLNDVDESLITVRSLTSLGVDCGV